MKSTSEIKIKGALHSYGEGGKEKIEMKSEKRGLSFGGWQAIALARERFKQQSAQ